MTAACLVEGCARQVKGRGMCGYHLEKARRAGQLDPGYVRLDAWVNPLVCVCPVPDADPSLRFGECAICHRKPMGRAS